MGSDAEAAIQGEGLMGGFADWLDSVAAVGDRMEERGVDRRHVHVEIAAFLRYVADELDPGQQEAPPARED